MRRLQVRVGLDCSVNEFRRLIGQPDLVPLVELASLVTDAALVRLIRRETERDTAPAPVGSAGSDRTGESSDDGSAAAAGEADRTSAGRPPSSDHSGQVSPSGK